MILCVIKSEQKMVLVFDEDGEQIPEYQGQYEEVKEKILRDAPPEAVFTQVIDSLNGLRVSLGLGRRRPGRFLSLFGKVIYTLQPVTREEW